jgi:hypothetical protein
MILFFSAVTFPAQSLGEHVSLQRNGSLPSSRNGFKAWTRSSAGRAFDS